MRITNCNFILFFVSLSESDLLRSSSSFLLKNTNCIASPHPELRLCRALGEDASMYSSKKVLTK